MIVFDASVLIAHFSERDKHHAQAGPLVAAAVGRPCAASAITLAEVLVGPTRVGTADRMRGVLDAMRVASIAVGADDPAALASIRATTGLTFPDCCVLLAAQQVGATAVLTFDERLGAAAEAAGFAREVAP